MSYSEYIIKTLEINDIDTYFLITGGAIVPFINFLDKLGKKYYCFQHEQSAAMAAEGYFRSCGKVACVVVTSGPGVQNIMNGLCGCWYDSIPAVFITGQVNTKESLDNLKCSPRQSGFQEMPVVECFKYFTKVSVKITSSDYDIKDILKILKTPRYGPVLIDLPVNIQMESCTLIPSKSEEYKPTYVKTHIDLSGYTRPLVIVGTGVKLSKTEKEFMKFVETNSLPFVVSWGAFDICPSDHPLRIGSHGVYGDRVANFAVQNADLLIVVGSRLDSRQTGGNFKSFSRFSKKIIVDIDRDELYKLEERGIILHQKILTPLENFFKHLEVSNASNYSNWIDKLSECRKIFVDNLRDGVYDILPTLFEKFPHNAIIIPDQGGNLVWTMQTATIKGEQSLFTNLGNSSMGFALPCAIGAAIGSDRPVICIDGDGGFQMNIQELLTVSKYKLPIDIYILNNSGYGIIKQFQDNYFNSNYVATTKQEVFGEHAIPFEEIAKCYGVNTLYDIKIPEDQKIFPKLEFGNSLENMSPYKNEVTENMITECYPPKQLANIWNS